MTAGGPRSARFGDLGLRVVSGLVLAAIAFAEASPFPLPEQATDDVFAA